MPQKGEMNMSRSDRHVHVHSMAGEQHKFAGNKHAAVAASSGFSAPLMSKAQVVYYLSRGGKMEPPHMIEVPYLHDDGLRLKDVKHRLTILRGGGMPNMFSWSCKRIYKNTHIWQDVCDDDCLTPVSGGEYILKGSEYFDTSQEKCGKTSTQVQTDTRSQELVQRKFRGAEAWLKASGPLSPVSGKPVLDPGENYNLQSSTNQLKNLVLDNVKRPPNPEASSSDESTSKTTNGNGTGLHEDIKVCEVSRPSQSQCVETACSVATQTEENGYGYSYKSSGSSTPTCFGRHEAQQVLPNMSPVITGGNMPCGKSTRRGQIGKLKKRLGGKQQQPHGKESSGPKVKMKHSSASCMFLHILSHCGGVDTKMQRHTEVASSEYSFEGVCRADGKLMTRSPQYSVEQIMMDNTRSGPLIPYSSEYFDVKETVTPLQTSPLQTKSHSRFQQLGR